MTLCCRNAWSSTSETWRSRLQFSGVKTRYAASAWRRCGRRSRPRNESSASSPTAATSSVCPASASGAQTNSLKTKQSGQFNHKHCCIVVRTIPDLLFRLCLFLFDKTRIFIQFSCLIGLLCDYMNQNCAEPGYSFQTLRERSLIGYYKAILNVITLWTFAASEVCGFDDAKDDSVQDFSKALISPFSCFNTCYENFQCLNFECVRYFFYEVS